MSYISTYIPPHFNKTISNNRRQKSVYECIRIIILHAWRNIWNMKFFDTCILTIYAYKIMREKSIYAYSLSWWARSDRHRHKRLENFESTAAVPFSWKKFMVWMAWRAALLSKVRSNSVATRGVSSMSLLKFWSAVDTRLINPLDTWKILLKICPFIN